MQLCAYRPSPPEITLIFVLVFCVLVMIGAAQSTPNLTVI